MSNRIIQVKALPVFSVDDNDGLLAAQLRDAQGKPAFNTGNATWETTDEFDPGRESWYGVDEFECRPDPENEDGWFRVQFLAVGAERYAYCQDPLQNPLNIGLGAELGE